MVRGSSIAVLLVCGCLLPNPAFDEALGASGASGTGSAGSTGGPGVMSSSGSTGGPGGSDGTSSEAGTGVGGSATGSSGECVGCVCAPGASEPCYAGEPGTEGVGECKGGTRVCDPSGAAWGPCEGEVKPSMDICGDGLDQDCNGTPDDAAMCMPDPECPQMDGLIACYPFPDGVTDVLVDGSVNVHDGAMSGVSLVSSVMGQGKAGAFAPGSLVSIDEQPGLSPEFFTIALLIRPQVGLMEAGLVDKENQFGLFHHAPGAIECIVVNDKASIRSVQAAVKPGAWSMVACTFDGKDVTMYTYEGGPVASVKVAMGGKLAVNGSGMHVGSNAPQGDQKFVGEIDRVMYFDRGLTAAELCALAGPQLCP